MPDGTGRPAGEVYDWYVRGRTLLETGNAEAAASLLSRALADEPTSSSVLEALARALFDAGRYVESGGRFADLVRAVPDDDYAQFGLGLALTRQGRLAVAVEHLALASAMRPGRTEYTRALREARATVTARLAAGLDPDAVGRSAPEDRPEGSEAHRHER